MRDSKKKIPLIVLETLEKYVELKGEQFEVVPPDKFFVKIIDKDKNSDFYYNIENYKIDKGLKLLIDSKPISKENIDNSRTWIDSKHLNNHFNNWVSLLKRYETVNSFFDDPIVKAYADEYLSEFEIIDVDADIKPFNTTQVLMLDSHLESIEKNIDKFKTDENESQIESIKTDVQELRNNLTAKPKRWIIKNLSIIWAKITKQGTPLLKEFLSEVKKTIIKEGVKFMIEQSTNIIT